MTEYVVTWEIDIGAESPREAAELAFQIMQDRNMEAQYFDVTEATGRIHHVDLQEPPKENDK